MEPAEGHVSEHLDGVTSFPPDEWNALDFANRLMLGEFDYNLHEHLARLAPEQLRNLVRIFYEK